MKVLLGPSLFLLNVIAGDVPARSLLDHGSKVTLARKEKQGCSKEQCHVRNLPLNVQPIGASGTPLGAIALVSLQLRQRRNCKCCLGIECLNQFRIHCSTNKWHCSSNSRLQDCKAKAKWVLCYSTTVSATWDILNSSDRSRSV